MPRMSADDGLDKFQRHRANRRSQGMKLLRIWVPDPRAPGFAAEAKRQAALLRGTPDNEAALDFIEGLLKEEDWQ